jgi:hypothetical protein
MKTNIKSARVNAAALKNFLDQVLTVLPDDAKVQQMEIKVKQQIESKIDTLGHHYDGAWIRGRTGMCSMCIAKDLPDPSASYLVNASCFVVLHHVAAIDDLPPSAVMSHSPGASTGHSSIRSNPKTDVHLRSGQALD